MKLPGIRLKSLEFLGCHRSRIVVPAGTQVYDPAGKVVAVAAADIEGSYIHPSQFVNYAGCPFDGRQVHVPIALEQLIVRVRQKLPL